MSDMRAKYALLGVTIVATLGILTASMVPAVTSPTSNMGLLMGHVSMVVTDGDGNIKHYFQSDNQVTKEGTDCAMLDIFQSTAGDTCPLGLGGPGFSVIALCDTAQTPASTYDKGDWTTAACEVARAAATSNTFTALNVVTLVKTFTVADDVGDSNILDDDESVRTTGLFDATGAGAGNLIAVFDLPATISGLVDGDDLTITWAVTGSQV